MKKNVLFLMIEVGLGHKMPALALAEGLERRWPGRFSIDVSDLARESGAVREDRLIKESWKTGGRHAWVFRLLYFILNLLHPLGQVYPQLAMPGLLKKGAAWIAKRQPDLVVATHPLCGMVAARARRLFKLEFRLVLVVVDLFDAYSWWAQPDADLFVVFSNEAAAQLRRRGIADDRIGLHGFPVRPEFIEVGETRESVLVRLDLDPVRPVLLATAGGDGLGTVKHAVMAVVEQKLAWNVIFVCGRNQALRREMEAFLAAAEARAGGRTRVRLIGFTDEMNRLLAAADLVIGKAGASSAMEALCMGRPFLFTDWIAQNDLAIIRFFEKNGYGWYVPGGRAAAERLDRFLERPDADDAPAAARKRILAGRFASGVDGTAETLANLAEMA